MTPAQIKNITLGIIAALILLSGWGMNIWTAHEFKSYKDSITEQVSINEANKKAKEAKDAKITQDIKDQYNSDVARLNDRLLSVTNLHRSCTVQLASVGNSRASVRETPNPASGVNAAASLKPPVDISFDPADALRDSRQLQRLIEWEKAVEQP